MRWLLLKDLQILRRSPLLVALLVVYPIVIALLIGFALSRGPAEAARRLPQPGAAGGERDRPRRPDDRRRRSTRASCSSAIEPIRVHTRAEAIDKVKSGRRARRADHPGRRHAEARRRASQPRAGRGDLQRRGPGQGALRGPGRSPRAWRRPTRRSPDTFKNVAAQRPQPAARRRAASICSASTLDILGLQQGQDDPRRDDRARCPTGRRTASRSSRSPQFARLAIDNLDLSDPVLPLDRQPGPGQADVVLKGKRVPLDAFAVAVAVTVSLMFVTLLLAAGMLALEREENAFVRLVRGLVSRTGLLVEKVVLAALCAVPGDAADAGRDRPVRDARLEPLPALAARAGGRRARRSAAMGVAIGGVTREVRAASLLAFVLSLPIAFLALVPVRLGVRGPLRRDPRDLGGCSRSSPRSTRWTPRSTARAATARAAAAPRDPDRGLRARSRGWRCGASPEPTTGARRARLSCTAMAFPATRLRRLRKTGVLRDLVRETELAVAPPRLPDVRRARPRRPRADRGDAGDRPALDLRTRSRRPARPPRSASRPCCCSGSRPRRTRRAPAPTTTRASSSSPTRAIKDAHPDLVVITDVCLCEYTDHGHCGVVRDDGEVDNDARSSCSPAPRSRRPRPAPTSSRRAT